MEWLEEGVRYVGYFSEPRKELAVKQREEGMQGAEAELNRLAQIAAKGRYYSWTRLRETINDLLESCGVRGLRNIKSFLNIRPIYHYKSRRGRAHVLIYFHAYYLVKKMELECRSCGVIEEVVPLLRDWNDLQLVSLTVTVGKHSRSKWQWSLGPIGEGIKGQIERLGWWRNIDKYQHSLFKS